MAVERATKSLRDTPLPKAKRGQRKTQPPTETFSFRSDSLSFTGAFQRLRNLCGMSGEIDAVDITRSRQVHSEFLLDATWMRRKKQNPIAQTCGFANIVRYKNDRFATRFPNLLNVAVKLLASEGIKRGKRFVHEQDAWIGCKRASQRDALLHSAGKFVNVCVFKPAQPNELQIVLGNLASVSVCQVRFELKSEEDIPKHIQPGKERRFLKHDKPLAARSSHCLSVR